MKQIPPVGWADVATKRDLDRLGVGMTSRMEIMELRLETMEHRLLAGFYKELTTQTLTLVLVMTGLFLTAAGIAVAAAIAL